MNQETKSICRCCGKEQVILADGTLCCMGTLDKFNALYGYYPAHLRMSPPVMVQ